MTEWRHASTSTGTSWHPNDNVAGPQQGKRVGLRNKKDAKMKRRAQHACQHQRRPATGTCCGGTWLRRQQLRPDPGLRLAGIVYKRTPAPSFGNLLPFFYIYNACVVVHVPEPGSRTQTALGGGGNWVRLPDVMT